MYLKSLFGILSLAPFAVAGPLGDETLARSPSRTVKRAEPSPYPGGDPCVNEFHYLNFDINNDNDRFMAETVHEAFCTGWPQLVKDGHYATVDDVDIRLFARYFDAGDDNENRPNVREVWERLYNFEADAPNEIIAEMTLDKIDFQNMCGEADGYLATDDADGLEKIHICDEMYHEHPAVPSDNECQDLDDVPSVAMENMARLLLHEMLHSELVGFETALGQRITDQDNKDGIAAYYPQRAHGLVDTDQDNQDGEEEGDDRLGWEAPYNADSYAWLANNAYYKYACTNVGETPPNDGNFDDPEPYTAGGPGDQ